jgi:hypothetical protein
MQVACCCIEQAAIKSTRSVKYEASEQFELGNKESSHVKKVMYDAPGAPSHFESKDPSWKSCPWWTCMCCTYEFRGECACRLLPKQKDNSLSGEKVNWVFEEHDADDLFLEFQYRDVVNETDRLRSKDHHAKGGDFIRLKLETNHENVDGIHKNARKLVSMLTVTHSDFAVQFEEAKEADDLRKQAAVAKAANAGSAAAFIAESGAAGGGGLLGGGASGANMGKMLSAVSTLGAAMAQG